MIHIRTAVSVALAALLAAPLVQADPTERVVPFDSATPADGASPPLLDMPLSLRANVAYTTGVVTVVGAPRYVRRIKLVSVGSPYCHLVVDSLAYTSTSPGELKLAHPTGTDATFDIYDGVIYVLSINFHQVDYDGVVCNLRVLDDSAPPSPPPPTPKPELLLGAVHYTGGFDANASLRVSVSFPVGALRFAVPSFCGPVDVLEAGTVVSGVYYKASTADQKSFTVDTLGAHAVTEVRAALNGPTTSVCDIPVYATPAAE